MRALIDTCVIIDALQSREPFRADAEKVFYATANMRCIGYITAKSVADIYYLMLKCFHSGAETRKVLQSLLSIFDILDAVGIDCRKVLHSELKDYEDAIMVESAVRAELNYIVTRNIWDYVGSPIPIHTPDKFIQLIPPEK